MKKLSFFTVLFLTLALFMAASCNIRQSENASSDELDKAVIEHGSENRTDTANEAVVIQQDLFFARDAALNSGYARLPIGAEVLIDGRAEPVKSGSSSYIKVQNLALPEQVGYVNEYFIMRGGRIALVTTDNAILQANPDNKRIESQSVPVMALIGVDPSTERNGMVLMKYSQFNWLRIFDKYIPVNDLSFDQNDIDAAVYYQLALETPDPIQKERYIDAGLALNSLAVNPYISAYKEFTEAEVQNNFTMNATVTAASAYLYAEPQADSMKFITLYKNFKLTLTSRIIDSKNTTWYRDANYGWITADNVAVEEADTAEA
jgi:hypothetical protein